MSLKPFCGHCRAIKKFNNKMQFTSKFCFFLHVSYSCNLNLNEAKTKIGDLNGIQTHGLCANSVTIHFNLLQFCLFMIPSFFYRDYTRPDLPSGPNESPFAGADIAGLAALGKQMLFCGCFQTCTCQCIHHIFKITSLNFYCHQFLLFSYCSYVCCVHNDVKFNCDGEYQAW